MTKTVVYSGATACRAIILLLLTLLRSPPQMIRQKANLLTKRNTHVGLLYSQIAYISKFHNKNVDRQCLVSSNHEYIQGDYKWCKRLHQFIRTKVKGTQKSNARHCKEQLKNLFLRTFLRSTFNSCHKNTALRWQLKWEKCIVCWSFIQRNLWRPSSENSE
jgi:hypothetical protein